MECQRIMAWNLVVPCFEYALLWWCWKDGGMYGVRVYGTLLGPETTGPIPVAGFVLVMGVGFGLFWLPRMA